MRLSYFAMGNDRDLIREEYTGISAPSFCIISIDLDFCFRPHSPHPWLELRTSKPTRPARTLPLTNTGLVSPGLPWDTTHMRTGGGGSSPSPSPLGQALQWLLAGWLAVMGQAGSPRARVEGCHLTQPQVAPILLQGPYWSKGPKLPPEVMVTSGPCCSQGSCLGLQIYCSRVLSWCPWPVLPSETVDFLL